MRTENLIDRSFVAARCEKEDFARWEKFIKDPKNSPEALEAISGVPAADVRAAARLFATGGNAAIYYGLGVTEHSQGSTTVMAMANLAMATGNIGREGVGVNPLRGQNNVQGSCDMGSFPHEYPGYRHVSNEATRKLFEKVWHTQLDPEPGLRIPNMFDEASGGTFKGLFVQGEDIAQSDPNTQHVDARAGVARYPRRAGPLPQRDRSLRARVPARHLVPGEGRHLHQRRASREPRTPGDEGEAGHGGVGDRLPSRHRDGLPDDLPDRGRHHGRDFAP